MNGEQFSVLVFGPKIKFNIKECVDKFNLINKRQWVNNFINTHQDIFEAYEIELMKTNMEFQEINDIFNRYFYDDEDIDKYQLLLDFLVIPVESPEDSELILDYVFDNNVDWSKFLVGYIVKDYNTFKEAHKIKVINFCKKYNLPEPTFYGAIIGEFE